MMHDDMPVIVGVGEAVEHLSGDLRMASSAQELAARAAAAALRDASAAGELAAHIDVVVATRTFPDTTPMWPAPFGRTDNMPRSIAKRVGADPCRAIYAIAGGQSPQRNVNRWSEKLAAGEVSMVLLAGAEVIASTKAALKAGIKLDWSETVDGDMEDEGLGLEGLLSFDMLKHGIVGAPPGYALCENARRVRLGMSREDYARRMAEVLAPFSQVAKDNPYSMFDEVFTPEQILEPTSGNSYIAWPYTKAMVAKDGVNQAAAVLLTTVGKARELGIVEDKWIFLNAYADANEKKLLNRPDLGSSPALKGAIRQALEIAEISGKDLNLIDVYSCFPIVVLEAMEALGLEPGEKRLTETGGLSFFGGPGNNYSMHGIAAVVRGLRGKPGAWGMVSANGGIINKHSVGVYSTRPAWRKCSSARLQSALEAVPDTKLEKLPDGPGTIETYTVEFRRGQPEQAIVVGRLDSTGERFVANGFPGDAAFIESLLNEDMAGQPVMVAGFGKNNCVASTYEEMQALRPEKATAFRENYEYCRALVNGNVLEVVITRPDQMNALNPMAHEELDEIFDLFEANPSLWVAIITGEGEKAFCTGNDLKYSASGKPVYMPRSGFGGLTSRARTKPVVAAVNGYAFGGGMEIALACDIVIAAETALFALPEVKVGLIAGAGGIQRLTRQIHVKQAMDMLITGRQVSAEEGKTLGFVNQVVPAMELMTAARDYAKLICKNSPTSVRLTKEMLAETERFSAIDDAMRVFPDVLDKLLASEDFIEGPRAFAQKRPPRWSGR